MTQRIAALLALFAVGCSSDGDPAAREYIAAVTTVDGTTARLVGGAPPSGDGPSIMVSTNAAVIPGGTTRVRLSADRAFARANIGITGIDGYYELTLPAAAAQAELLVTLAQSLDVDSFQWSMSAGGPVTMTPARVVSVGTGDVQVSLSWNTPADVDLHVVDPSGEEILWLNRTSASGGELDLDSNAACSDDGPRNENITWADGGAPAGTYRVLVDYWDFCGAASTDYTVTVNVRGREPVTFSGTFTGEGDHGGIGDGTPITMFANGNAAARVARRVHVIDTTHVEPGDIVYEK